MKAPIPRFAYIAAIVVVASYALMTLSGPHGLSALFEKRREIHAMEKSNAELARDIERRRERIERLSKDPAEQERIIKDRLKLVSPEEKVFILADPAKK